MLRLAVFVGLVALSLAASSHHGHHDHCCSHEDRNIVQQQWKVLWTDSSSSKIKIGFGRVLLTKLVEAKPELKEIFKSSNIDHPESPEFSAKALRIMTTFDLIINLLQDPDTLDVVLENLADHLEKDIVGFKPEHLQTVAELMNRGLRRVMDEYNSMSWKSCFRGIFNKLGSKLH